MSRLTGLKKQIFHVYQKHTGAPRGTYGMQTWFAAHCDRDRRAVYRWCKGGMANDQQEYLRILRILEALPAGTPWARDPAKLDAPLPKDFPGREALRAAGYKSEADVFHAPDADLLATDGIGPSVLARIRDYWAPEEAHNGVVAG